MTRPFATNANQPSRSPSATRASLTDTHPPMPNLNLSNQQMEDIGAYSRACASAEQCAAHARSETSWAITSAFSVTETQKIGMGSTNPP